MEVGGQRHTLAALPPGKNRYPGRVRKISPPPGFDPRTVQHVASPYTNWAIPAHWLSTLPPLTQYAVNFAPLYPSWRTYDDEYQCACAPLLSEYMNRLKSSDNYVYRQLQNLGTVSEQTIYLYTVDSMSLGTAFISLYNIHWFAFLMAGHGVPCEVLTLPSLGLTLLPLTRDPRTPPPLPWAHCPNPASCPFCDLHHPSIL
jgi:hypothetical protein